MENWFQLADSIESRWRYQYDDDAGFDVNFYTPYRLNLSGTPLDHSLVLIRDYLKDFKSNHNLDIVSLITLTDGSSHGCMSGNAHIVDRQINRVFKMSNKNSYRATHQLLDWMIHWKREKHGIYLEWFQKELATVLQQAGYESRPGWCYSEFAQGLIALEEGDEAQLNKMIEKTVKQHHVIYQSPNGLNPGDPPMHDDHDGFICLKALALAAMAYDKGWEITYESDYLPRFLVEYKG